MSDNILTKDDLNTLLETLIPIASKYWAFGLQLGVKEWKISNIKQNHSKCEDQLYEILVARLSQEKPLTWRDIVTALKSRSVQEDKVAWGIEQECLIRQDQQQNQPIVSQCIKSQSPSVPSNHSKESIPMSRISTSDSITDSSASVTSNSMTLHIETCLSPISTYQNSTSPSTSHGTSNISQSKMPHTAPPKIQKFNSYPCYQGQQLPWQYHHHQQGAPGYHSCPQLAISTDPSSQRTLTQHPPHPIASSFSPHIPYHTAIETPPQITSSIYQELGPPVTKKQRLPVKPHTQPDPLVQYIDYVKTVYRNSEVEKDTRTVKWPPTPSKIYINLVCIDHGRVKGQGEGSDYHKVTETMVRYGDPDVVRGKKWPIDFNEIAAGIPDTGNKRLVLVEGAPGAGKSTFAWEYCRRWMKGEIAQQYTLVLLFRLRDERMARAKTLRDLICHALEEVQRAVVDDLVCSHGLKTLIILEGFDELPDVCRTPQSIFLQLICGELLPLATVMVTSRPWATEMFLSSYRHRIFQHIEILGFTAQQISEYIESVLPNNEESKDLQLYVERHPQIRGCMYIPLNSAIVVTVYQESQSSGCPMPTTLTGLYTALARVLLVRHLYGQPAGVKRDSTIGVFSDLRVPHEVERNFTELCKLAYNGIVSQEDQVQLIFKDSDLPANFDNLGFMDSVTELYVTRGTVSSHNFLHLTFQEFFAAVHISTLSPDQQLEHFNRRKDDMLTVVLRFLAGITKLSCLSHQNEEHKFLIECKVGNLPLEANFVIEVDVINWLFEAQIDNFIELLNTKQSHLKLQTLDINNLTVKFTNCNDVMLPMDYYSLGYCISHIQCQWVLELDDIIQDEVDMLVAGASVKPDTNGRVVELFLGDVDADPVDPSNLFNGLENILHLQELHLRLKKISNVIKWPNMSSLQKLHLLLWNEDSRLDTLLPLLNLECLEIVVWADNVSSDDCVSITSYLTNSTTLKGFTFSPFDVGDLNVDMEPITKALSTNPQSLRNLTLGSFEYTYTALEYLAEFITKSTTLQRLELDIFIPSVNILRVLCEALTSNTTLQEKNLEFYINIKDDDSSRDNLEKLFEDYPDMRQLCCII